MLPECPNCEDRVDDVPWQDLYQDGNREGETIETCSCGAEVVVLWEGWVEEVEVHDDRR